MATVAQPIDVLSARIFSTLIPEQVVVNGTNFPATGYAFAQNSVAAVFFNLGCELYGNSGNMTLDLHWYSRSGSTTGNVTWSVQLAAITPGDAQSVETKAFATAQTATVAVNATAKGDTLSTVTISNLDSANAGDDLWLKVIRTDTSMVGDAILIRGSLSYSDGNSGTAGSGDFVGPASATTTAVVLFNGTTGKLGMNSVLTVDASGNIAGGGTFNGVTIAKYELVAELSSTVAIASATATTLQNITALSIALPRAGTYWVSGMLMPIATATLTSAYGMNVSTGLTRMNIAWQNILTATTFTASPQTTSLAVAGTGVASGSRSITTAIPAYLSGSVTVSTAATLQLLASASTSTLTFGTGSAFMVREL